jgi:hypothetical protein
VDFGQKGGEVGVAMGGFDVDDGVEGVIREGEVLGVALDEGEVGHGVAILTEADADGVEVEPGVVGGVEGAGDPGSAAAVTATDLEHVEVGEVDLAGDVVVELDGGAVDFVCWGEGERGGGSSLEGVVEEEDVVGLEATGEEGVPEPPEGFADGGDGEQALEKGHVGFVAW